MKSVCSGRRRATSSDWGSLTFRISSAASNTASASATIVAPWSRNCWSLIALPSPAPAWISTSWPREESSRTPAGVIATRYSSDLISVGTPILIAQAPFP